MARPAEPAPGCALTLQVAYVELYAEVPLVRLWGSLEEQRAEYSRLRADIQAAAPALERGLGGGGLGDWYLVELGGLWHRGRLLSRPVEAQHSVFLLDQGRTVGRVPPRCLARSPEAFLRLAPELICCVLANVAPAEGPAARWSPRALQLLLALPGQRLAGTVRQVLPQQRLLVLEVPALARKLQELGLALLLPEAAFRQSCLPLLGYSGLAEQQPPPPSPAGPLTSGLDYFYPLLQTGGAEPVLVTQVWEPGRVFCQLRSLSQEVQRLSDSMYHSYQAGAQGPPLPEALGQPCAARGADGRWHRALLRQIFPERDLVQVIHVDYGRRELVPRGCLRPLMQEYFRMPVVTYPCSLFGVSESASGCWSPRQVGELRALLLGQPVSARVEYYSSYERVYFVTLYGEDGLNLNSLFSMQAHCPAEAAGDGLPRLELVEPSIPALTGGLHPTATPDNLETSKGAEKHCLPAKPSECGVGQEVTIKHSNQPIAIQSRRQIALPASELKAAKSRQLKTSPMRRELKINAFYDATIDFIRDPSTLWLRAGQDEALHFTETMSALLEYYSRLPKLEKILMQPPSGEPCCAKLGAHFYRATVLSINNKMIEVYFWDNGNTEMVDWYDIKELEPQFMDPPPFAIKCSLADVVPLGKSWSHEATGYFKEIVLNRALVIQVLAKEDDAYLIEVLDDSREGERNISKLITQAGHARYQEFEAPLPMTTLHSRARVQNHMKQSVKGKKTGTGNVPLGSKMSNEKTIKSSLAEPQKCNDSATRSTANSGRAAAEKNNRNERTPPKPLSPHSIQASAFQGQDFDIGSVLDVQVSYMETPGLFWCQVAKLGQELKSLMQKIQDYCKKSFSPFLWNKLSCLAKYSEDNKWYRAVITSTFPMNGVPPDGVSQVNVVYVDFGNTETVPIHSLQSISEEFVSLRAQAFKCSLYNLIQPIGRNPFLWDEKAIASFQEFVNAGHVELKCTLFALASVHNELFYVVDLNTPFHSVSRHLIESGFARSSRFLEPSVCLHSYYYSTHDVKIGSEEVVFVSHVEKPFEFYCHLERNSCSIEQLSSSVNLLGNSLKHFNKSQNTKGLCLAKYTDQHWYRGMLRGTDHNPEVFFVDFGNKDKIAESDIRPVPNDACDVLLQPMQAIKCGLSDVPISVAEQVTVWFKKAVMDKALRAVVVAKDINGRLLVELYDGADQINAQIKDKLGLACARERNSIPAEHGLSKNMKMREEKSFSTFPSKADERKTLRSEFRETLVKRSTTYGAKTEADKASKCEVKEEQLSKKNKYSQHTTRDSLLPNPKKTQENKFCQKLPNFGNKLVGGSLPHTKEHLQSAESVLAGKKGEPCIPRYKLCDLPQKNIVPGLKTEVYISHIKDPSDFNVQLTEDEAQIAGVSEKLNECKDETKNLQGSVLQAGDVICALFPDDTLWYRAVLKEKCSDGLHVEYLDYGNTAVIDSSKTRTLAHNLSSIPALSIRCSLSGLDITSNWTPEAMAYLSQKSSEQLNCKFVQLLEHKWQVHLLDAQGIVIRDLVNTLLETNDLPKSEPNQMDLLESVDVLNKSSSSKKSIEEPSWTDVKMFKWTILKMEQTVEAYPCAIDGPDYFWCQCAEAEDIDALERKLQKAGDHLRKNTDCAFHSGDPCMVKYSEDEKWYRAIIKELKGEHLTVTFVDYGNEETVGRDAVSAIPVELLMIPVQAFPCCLWGFNAAQGLWTSEGIDLFYEIAMEDKLEVTAVEVRTYENICEIPLSYVKLQRKGKNINEEMTRFWQQTSSDACNSVDGRTVKENLETSLVLPPVSEHLTDNVLVRKELSEESESLVQDTEPSSDSLQEGSEGDIRIAVSSSLLAAETTATVLHPLLLVLPAENHYSTEDLHKQNESSVQDVEPSLVLLQEESDGASHVSVSSSLLPAEATPVASPSVLFESPAEDVCSTEGVLAESHYSMQTAEPNSGLWHEEHENILQCFVAQSDSLQGKDATLILPLTFEVSTENLCLAGEVQKESDESMEYTEPFFDLFPGTDTIVVLPPVDLPTETESRNRELLKDSEHSLQDDVPHFDSLLGPDATVVLPPTDELQKETVYLTGELPTTNYSSVKDIVPGSDSWQGDNSSFLQDTLPNSYPFSITEATPLSPLSIEAPTETVCSLDLKEQHDCCRDSVLGLNSLQEGLPSAMEDFLPSSDSLQKIDTEIHFPGETENQSMEIHETENQSDETCVNDDISHFIIESNEVGKCQTDYPFLNNIEMTPFINKEQFEIEQSLPQTLDACEVGSVKSKGENMEQRNIVEDAAEMQEETSLSNILMSEEESQVEEEETSVDCDAGWEAFCPDREITTNIAGETSESKAASTSDPGNEGMSDFCLDHEITTSVPEENFESDAASSCDAGMEGCKAFCPHREITTSVPGETSESKAASLSDPGKEECEAFCPERVITTGVPGETSESKAASLSDPGKEGCKAFCPDREITTSVPGETNESKDASLSDPGKEECKAFCPDREITTSAPRETSESKAASLSDPGKEECEAFCPHREITTSVPGETSESKAASLSDPGKEECEAFCPHREITTSVPGETSDSKASSLSDPGKEGSSFPSEGILDCQPPKHNLVEMPEINTSNPHTADDGSDNEEAVSSKQSILQEASTFVGKPFKSEQ